MKSIIACFFFFIFSIRPAYNVAYIAYFELNIDYIIKTYCINEDQPDRMCKGKCHLAKQLNISTPKDSNAKQHFLSFYEAFFPVFYQENHIDVQGSDYSYITSSNWSYQSNYNSIEIALLYPPPKV